MKNNRIISKKKLVSGLLATSITLGICSCANTKDTIPPETIVIIETVVVTATPTPTKEVVPTNTPVPTSTPIPTNTPVPTSTPIPTNTPIPTEKPIKTTTESTEYHSADDGLDATLDKIYNKINDINRKIDEVDFNKVKEKSIQTAKDLIDFIFYGKEMNGKTFDELKDDAKQEIYAKLQALDSFIMQFIPDYKEKIGEKYNYVKNFANTTLEKAKQVFNKHIEVNVYNMAISNKKTLKLTNNKNE